jgi:arylsulfatase A-like enzyme
MFTLSKNKKPNVIWFLVDQMRADAMSHRGDPNINTPNLDRFAIEASNFTDAVSGTPLCTPFRGSLVTGMYPHNSTAPALHSPLSMEIPSVADALNEAGYRTCWIGKWHLDGNRPELDLTKEENKMPIRHIPKERRAGFQDWWAYENNNQPFNCKVHTDTENGTETFRLPGYETDSLTDLTIDYIRNHQTVNPEQPFFVSLSVQPPHDPYVAPEENMRKFMPKNVKLRQNVPDIKHIKERAQRELAGYYAAIERIDYNFGRLRAFIREMDLDQDTYIIFFSDHGDMHGSHGQFRKMAPWEESIRIPFLAGGPTRKVYKTKEISSPINHVDIAPTTLGLCGVEQKDTMEGFDYSPLILEDFPPDIDVPSSAYISLPVPAAYQFGVMTEEAIDKPFRGVVTENKWKYMELEGRPWLLYNLNEDPYEEVNLANSVHHKTKLEELQKELQYWIQSTNDNKPIDDLLSNMTY